MIIAFIGDEFSEFIAFLNKNNIISSGVGLIIALQINRLFLDFIADIVKPVANKIVSEDIDKHETNLLGISFKFGHLLTSIINFLITMIFIFYLYKITQSTPTVIENFYLGIRSLPSRIMGK